MKITLGGIFTADKSGKGAAAGSTRRLFIDGGDPCAERAAAVGNYAAEAVRRRRGIPRAGFFLAERLEIV